MISVKMDIIEKKLADCALQYLLRYIIVCDTKILKNVSNVTMGIIWQIINVIRLIILKIVQYILASTNAYDVSIKLYPLINLNVLISKI